jgi:DNA-binding MarR family transcriptional regulator
VETVPLKDAPTKLYGGGAPLWDQVLAVLRRTLTPHAFNTWLKPTRQAAHVGDTLRVTVPGRLFREWIEKSYGELIAGALAGLGHRNAAVEFISPANEPASRTSVFLDASDIAAARRREERDWQTDRAFDYPTFRTSSGLIDKKHHQKIGPAIWEFLWCIDKQTGPHGLVLGGKPVTLAQIADDLGVPQRSVRRALGRLGQHRYIAVEHLQRGLRIRVSNQKKFGARRRRS